MAKKKKAKKAVKNNDGEEVIPMTPTFPEQYFSYEDGKELSSVNPTPTVAETEEKAKPEKPKVKVVYKTDARYEVFRGAVERIVKNRPDAGDVRRNPMLYHEWALQLERLLQ